MIKVLKSTEELQRIQSQLKEVQHFTFGLIKYKEKELNELAHYVELLEFNQLQITALGQYSILDILYSRYYWFTKFMVCYESIYSKDVSMDQVQFKIIEAINYEAAVDWDLLESIEKELGYLN